MPVSNVLHTLCLPVGVQEPPLQIGNWDQNMAVSESTVPATTTSTLTSINSRLGVSSASLTSVQSVGLSLDTKPSPSTGDKSSGSEQHDSGTCPSPCSLSVCLSLPCVCLSVCTILCLFRY